MLPFPFTGHVQGSERQHTRILLGRQIHDLPSGETLHSLCKGVDLEPVAFSWNYIVYDTLWKFTSSDSFKPPEKLFLVVLLIRSLHQYNVSHLKQIPKAPQCSFGSKLSKLK